MESLNRMATELVDEAMDFADELNVAVSHLENDAVVLDFGVEARGGVEAGLLLAEIATGGLATVGARADEVAGVPMTHVDLSTDHPLLALLAAQKAGWELDGGRAGGPARLFRREGREFDYLEAEESFDFATLVVEAATLPDESVARRVAERAGVPESGVFLPTAPAASVAGGVAAAARAAEVAAHRLLYLGYDPRDLLSATASAPVPPTADDERVALARTNDAIARGSRVHLVVDRDVERPGAVAFAATDGAGRPFADLIEEHGEDFAALDGYFAPAAATIDVVGGPTHAVGGVDGAFLADRWGL